MPKGGVLVNTARKEVINEAELIKLMEERTDLKYVTDIMPVAHAEFSEKVCRPLFLYTEKKWEPRRLKQISTQVLLPPDKL